MRRGTLIAVIVLFLLLAAAAAWQLVLSRAERRFPGPVPTQTPPVP